MPGCTSYEFILLEILWTSRGFSLCIFKHMRNYFSHYFVRFFCPAPFSFLSFWDSNYIFFDGLILFHRSTNVSVWCIFCLFFLCFAFQKSGNWKIVLYFFSSRNFLLSTVGYSEEVIIHILATVHLTGTELQLTSD